MSDTASRGKTRVYDPVFVMMIVAVVLAVGSSFALRLAVGGPKTATAEVRGEGK